MSRAEIQSVLYNNSGITKGYNFKLAKKICRTSCKKHFFVNRNIDNWNNLTAEFVNAESVNAFKSKNEKYLKNKIYLHIFY